MKGSIAKGRVVGTFYLRVELDRDAKGKRRRMRETFRGSRREAEERLRELLRESETGGLDPQRLSFKELCDRYLQAVEHRVGAKWGANLRQRTRDYIVPAFGGMRARDVRPGHIEAALLGWIKGGRKDSEDGHLSEGTIRHIYNTLRTICRWGVRMGVLSRNPVDSVEPPRVATGEMHVLDAAGVTKLLSAARDSEFEGPVAIAIATGLRRGELLGLRWSDVDLEAGRLSVRRALNA